MIRITAKVLERTEHSDGSWSVTFDDASNLPPEPGQMNPMRFDVDHLRAEDVRFLTPGSEVLLAVELVTTTSEAT